MLLREVQRGVIAIGQASHAWISGQLARAWGNSRFGVIHPQEEVCLGAEQHDVGMAAWDLNPLRNPDTGLPYSFVQMPVPVHLELWRAGPRRLLRQSRYAALLVAMHGRRLYEMRDLTRLPEAQADAVRAFLSEQRGFEAELTATLRADPATAPVASEGLLARNSQLIWVWDFLSLALCLDWAPTTARGVPSADGPLDLRLTPSGVGPSVIVDPWPFAERGVRVRCEGQLLTGRFETDGALAAALLEAPWETVEVELVQG